VIKLEIKMTRALIRFAEPAVGDEEANAAYEAIRDCNLRYGPQIEAFEKEVAKYIGVRYAVATSSGTAALHAALLALNTNPNEKVILQSFSCASPLIATMLSNAEPIFADIEPYTLNIDPEHIKNLIDSKTKVIIPIHYCGYPADIDYITDIAIDNNIYILEDCAEAFGAEYKGKKVGSFGQVAILSFSPNKIITTGEGGMLLTNDYEIYERARSIVDYGQKGRFNYRMLGHNYHMTAFQAAIGLVQMKKVEQILDKRKKLAKLYDELLANEELIDTPYISPNVKPSFMSYYVIFKTNVLRDKTKKYIEDRGIETRIYFPPLHKNAFYGKYIKRNNKLRQTEDISSRILNLPLSPKLTEDDVLYVTQMIKEALRS
jgi:perosamine synthetase